MTRWSWDEVQEMTSKMEARLRTTEKEAKHWQGEAIAMRARAERAEAEALRTASLAPAFGDMSAAFLAGRVVRLERLLREWFDQPEIQEPAQAMAWVRDFRFRVVTALRGEAEPPAAPKCEVCHKVVREGMRFCSGLSKCYLAWLDDDDKQAAEDKRRACTQR